MKYEGSNTQVNSNLAALFVTVSEGWAGPVGNKKSMISENFLHSFTSLQTKPMRSCNDMEKTFEKLFKVIREGGAATQKKRHNN